MKTARRWVICDLQPNIYVVLSLCEEKVYDQIYLKTTNMNSNEYAALFFLFGPNLNLLLHQVEGSAIWSMERSARIFQKIYEERAVADAEAGCGASW